MRGLHTSGPRGLTHKSYITSKPFVLSLEVLKFEISGMEHPPPFHSEPADENASKFVWNMTIKVSLDPVSEKKVNFPNAGSISGVLVFLITRENTQIKNDFFWVKYFSKLQKE